jgi:hypothetical protein
VGANGRRRDGQDKGDLFVGEAAGEVFEQLALATDGVTFAFDSVMPQATIDLFYRVNAGVFLGSITPEDAVAQLKASYETEIANQ